jgi:hypothetical protein
MIRDKVVNYTFNFLTIQTANLNYKIKEKKDKDFFWDDDWLLGYIMGACVNSLSIFLQRQLDSDEDLKDVDYVFGAMLTSLNFFDKEELDKKYEKKYEEFCKKLDVEKSLARDGLLVGQEEILDFYKKKECNETFKIYLQKKMK